MLTEQDIAEAKRALKELADEAQGNGNSEGWIAAQERPILAVIAAHEAKAAPAVPQGEPVAWLDLSKMSASAMVYATGWKSNDKQSPLYTAPAPAPAQEPVNRPQNCGTSYCSCIECLFEPSQPVTLTEAERMRCLVASGCIGTVKMTYDSGLYEITRTSINADRLIEAIIATLREKEGK